MLCAQAAVLACYHALHVIMLANSYVVQVFNGHSVTAVEVSKAQAMFQALHEARTAARQQPLNELVGPVSVNSDSGIRFIEQYMHFAKQGIWHLCNCTQDSIDALDHLCCAQACALL